MNKPYEQLYVSNNTFIRTFSKDCKSDELVWHRDAKDRQIIIIHNSGWKFQFDNEIPFVMKESFLIPKNTLHRVIRGFGDLKIMILES
jgi:hypothetical protein